MEEKKSVKYPEDNIRRYVLKVNKHTMSDVYEFLELQENVQGYVLDLIRRNMDEVGFVPQMSAEEGSNEEGMIKYYKLWRILDERGMKKSDLYSILSTVTVAKLGKGESVTTDVICRICEMFDCQPGDIMEYIKPKKNAQE